MSMTLLEKTYFPRPRRLPVARSVVAPRRPIEPIRVEPLSPASDDKGVMILASSVACIVLFALAPLILFLVLTFFYPDMFLISVTPE
ncbi:MAG: hypothetical protein ACE37I_07220 [Rubinisphaera brasiliensis]|uniref:hypothetical protein n=1 Tax=Rubinisphaera brasiliensis TaxID=119 RepID=UPI003918C89B